MAVFHGTFSIVLIIGSLCILPQDLDALSVDDNFFPKLVKRFESEASKLSGEEVHIHEEELQDALRVGREYVEKWEQLEAQISEENRKKGVNEGTTRATGSRRYSSKRHNPEAMARSKEAAIYLVARKYLSDRLGIPAEKIGDLGRLPNTASDRQACDFSSKFRNIDGTCNNIDIPLYGKSGTIFSRLIANSNEGYDDGISTIRKSKLTKNPLPSARLVSSAVVYNDSVPNPAVTLLTMQWGQFLDHDLTSTPTFTKSDGTEFACCSTNITGTSVLTAPHPECLPIAIPSNDPTYNPSSIGQQTCMNFIRSTYGNNLDGTAPRTRSHINALTHWIDASNVYGSTAAKAASLRNTTSGRGKLKTSISSNRQMLPLLSANVFDAGDHRVNEQPLLTIMHTLWVREHNRIADNLYTVAPNQTDEFYYQHARRIVIAEMQHIIYTEYLPVIIGPDLAAQVMSSEYGYYSGNPAIFTEFSTAAYRMGHSQVRSFIRLFDRSGRVSKDSYFLSDSFMNPSRLLTNVNFFDDALRGLLQVPAQAVDNCFADDITSQLFKPNGQRLGFDLIALNIQRGRDHGLPPYVSMLYYLASNFLLQTQPTNFDHLVPRIPAEIVASLRSVYETVYDVDLYIGGVAEKPLPNAELGPTFAGIFALQFLNLRRTDRFFYNYNVNQPTGFRSAQLAQIQRVSLARIICDNSDRSITTIQPKVFRTPDDLLNKPVPCTNLYGIDFYKMTPL